jgi:hypothetical protein
MFATNLHINNEKQAVCALKTIYGLDNRSLWSVRYGDVGMVICVLWSLFFLSNTILSLNIKHDVSFGITNWYHKGII